MNYEVLTLLLNGVSVSDTDTSMIQTHIREVFNSKSIY